MQSLELNGFSKVNESLDAELIQFNELSAMTDCILDKVGEVGKPNKRGGFTRFNTNSIDATNGIKALHDVKDEAGTNYLLGISGTKLRKSLNGTGAWSDVKTGLTTGLRTRLTTYGSRHILTNGIDKPFIVEGIDFATVNNLELETPNMQDVTITDSTGGNLTPLKSYAYTIVYRTEKGERSDYGCPLFIQIGNTGDYTSSFTNLPVPSDSRIVTKELYRTEAGGRILYLVTNLDIAATTYDDGAADTDLQLSQTLDYINIPVKAKYICNHKDRIILGYISILTTSVIQKPFWKVSVLDDLGGGSLAAGTYLYRYSNIFRDNTESILSTYCSLTVTGGSSKIRITPYYPFYGASQQKNTDIIGMRVYRTVAGASVGATVFWVGDSITDPVYDETTDATLVTQPQYPKSAQNTNIDYPNAIAISGISTPSEFPGDNLFLIGNDDTDTITGIFDDDNGIMIFKNRSIYKQFTSQSSVLNWNIERLQEKFGADIVTKNGNEYLVIFKKRVWIVSGSSKEEIKGYENSLDNIDSINDLIYYPKLGWYLLSVSISSVYYIYIYSNINGSWTTFNITKAECFEIKNISTGELLIGDGIYPIKYNVDSTVDNQTGSDSQILTYFKTKIFVFPDGITLGRLRYLHLQLKKKLSQNITITLTDPSTATGSPPSSLYLTNDITTGSGEINLTGKDRLITDGMTGELKKIRKLYIEIYGYGLIKFENARLEFRTIREGSAVGV